MKLKMTPDTMSKYLINCATTVCKTVLGEGGGGEGINEGRLVHILHDDTKICVDPQIQRSLGLFANVIFLSQNFILTIMMHRESHLILNLKNLPLNLIK